MAQTTNDNMAPANNHYMPGHSPGVGLSEPASTQASNIAPGDTRSAIAPRLPGSAMPGLDTTARQELQMAQRDLSAHRTGAAQEALERAETRLLDRSTPAGMTGTPDSGPMVQMISLAREALGRNDVAGAQDIVGRLISQQTAG